MKFFTDMADGFRSKAETLQDYLLLFIRLFWGIQFVMAGYNKWVGFPGTIKFIAGLGIPYPEVGAALITGTEVIAGALIVIGFLSRLASIPLIIAMVVAYATVHVESLKIIFSHPTAFTKEEPFNFLLMALFVLAFGPGRFSVDGLLFKK
jgi:putative oxidoreductase